jgi:hypothetical protein
MKRALVFSVCVIFAIAITGRNASADDAAPVLAKYRALVGWTLGDGSVQTLRLTGRVADLTTYDDICEASRFAQFNTSLSSGGVFLLQGDSSGVRISHLGESKDLPTQASADAFTQSMLLCNAFASYPATIITEITAKGKVSQTHFAVVALSIPNEPAILMSINESTGEIKSVAIKGIASYEPTALKSIDGQHRMYTQWKRIVSDDGTTAVMSVSSVQLNPQVNQEVFSSSLDLPPPQAPTGVVHF